MPWDGLTKEYISTLPSAHQGTLLGHAKKINIIEKLYGKPQEVVAENGNKWLKWDITADIKRNPIKAFSFAPLVLANQDSVFIK